MFQWMILSYAFLCHESPGNWWIRPLSIENLTVRSSGSQPQEGCWHGVVLEGVVEMSNVGYPTINRYQLFFFGRFRNLTISFSHIERVLWGQVPGFYRQEFDRQRHVTRSAVGFFGVWAWAWPGLKAYYISSAWFQWRRNHMKSPILKGQPQDLLGFWGPWLFRFSRRRFWGVRLCLCGAHFPISQVAAALEVDAFHPLGLASG